MLDWRVDHGYEEVVDFVYDEDYFAKYVGYANTEMGKKITEARVALVRRFCRGPVLDVGCGAGQFIEYLSHYLPAYGYDVNPASCEWLMDCGRFSDLMPFHAMTFWDSFEHIKDPLEIVKLAKRWVFICLPVFNNKEEILGSRHYRPDEHYWYFTPEGLVRFMKGFKLRWYDTPEVALGREGIGTFVFERQP